MKPNRSKRNELRRMESWPGLIAEVKHRMQLSPTSVFMHYMPFCSADHGRKGQSNIGKERLGDTFFAVIQHILCNIIFRNKKFLLLDLKRLIFGFVLLVLFNKQMTILSINVKYILSYGVHVSYGILVQVNSVLSIGSLWKIKNHIEMNQNAS
ncbi:hypothetical protein ALC53_11553 [Atta colombica]|uniref:Uncharacterized protein n=1 Tax=Atta colombica TaxID=520822 RepID=A0A195B1C1_9HYME|nr:hypothetical protein ALC53_11553 [Atta colombica]